METEKLKDSIEETDRLLTETIFVLQELEQLKDRVGNETDVKRIIIQAIGEVEKQADFLEEIREDDLRAIEIYCFPHQLK